jgi:hypothetical protein
MNIGTILNSPYMWMAYHKGGQSKFSEKAISGIIKMSTKDDFYDGASVGINKNEYSHTELIFPKWIAGDYRSFSSRGTAKPSGVAFLKLQETILKHPERWDFLPVEWLHSEKDIAESFKLAKSIEGAKYAYSNVFNTFAFIKTRKDRKGKKDFWCSEADAYALNIADYKVSPNRLYTLNFTMNYAYSKKRFGGV